MFDPKIDICPDGYDIDQTNFYLNSLHNKIESLEKQNEYLFKNFASLITLESKIDLILKHLNIDFCEESSEEDEFQIPDLCPEIQPDVTKDETKENDIIKPEHESLDLSFLRDEINALKSFVKER